MCISSDDEPEAPDARQSQFYCGDMKWPVSASRLVAFMGRTSGFATRSPALRLQNKKHMAIHIMHFTV